MLKTTQTFLEHASTHPDSIYGMLDQDAPHGRKKKNKKKLQESIATQCQIHWSERWL
jgi:hypothetical protein